MKERIVGNFPGTSTIMAGIASAVVASIGAGCGSGLSGSSSTSFSPPAIAPIVNQSLPSALQNSSASSLYQVRPTEPAQALNEVLSNMPVNHENATITPFATITPNNSPSSEMTNAIAYIKSLFSNYYVSPNDGKGYQGLVFSLVSGMDSRIQGIESQISSSGGSHACLSAANSSTVIDLSAIDPMLKFTTPYMQCSNVFSTGGSNVAGAGSGTWFGQNSSKTAWSVGLILVSSGGSGTTFSTTGGFYGSANVITSGSSSTVDGLLISYSPISSNGNSGNQITASRYTASPSGTGSFALFVGSNMANQPGFAGSSSSSGNGSTVGLGSGFRMVSDGVHIYADGYLLDTTSTGTYYGFNICMVASSMTLDSTPTDCSTLANGFVTTTWSSLYPGITNPNPLATTPSLNFQEVTGCTNFTMPSYTSGASLAALSSSNTSCNAGMPGNATSGNMTAPSSTVTNALNNISIPSSLTAF